MTFRRVDDDCLDAWVRMQEAIVSTDQPDSLVGDLPDVEGLEPADEYESPHDAEYESSLDPHVLHGVPRSWF